MKTIILTATAAVALGRYGGKAEACLDKLETYAFDPASQANNVKALKGTLALRLRVGSFRVLFTETANEIIVLDIGPRGGVYG